MGVGSGVGVGASWPDGTAGDQHQYTAHTHELQEPASEQGQQVSFAPPAPIAILVWRVIFESSTRCFNNQAA